METGDAQTFCGRFRVLEKLPTGGMARVFKVSDSVTKRQLALKIPIGDETDEFVKLAFQRECEALSSLSHQNIVELVDFGRVEANRSYLALEWLPGSLGELLQRQEPWNWESFYADIGEPLLQALAASHTREIAHRDIKPDNIRFDANGTLKLTDFGIAKARSNVGIGKTFKDAGTKPYTPPESDDDIHSFARDTYSWGAVAIACLCGQDFGQLHEMRAALEGMSVDSGPVEILTRCIALAPDRRPVNGIDLLAQVDAYHSKAIAGKPLVIFAQIGQKELAELSTFLGGKTTEESLRELERDLNGSVHGYVVPGEDRLVRLIGVSLDITCKAQDRDIFRITSIRTIGLERAESERRQSYELLGTQIKVFPALAQIPSASNQRALFARISAQEHERDRQLKRAAMERWFDIWSAVMREKERQQKEKRTQIRFVSTRRQGSNYVVVCEGDLLADLVPESLVYRLPSGRHVVFEVLGVFGDELTIRPQNMVGPWSVQSGLLESNFHAQAQPLARQKAALENIRKGNAASPKLKGLLCSPETAAVPEGSGTPPGLSSDLNDEKRELIERVLGIRSVFLVEGPPGTGKTTFIAELIRVYLQTFPASRILLSSQTHTALDHVISKLCDLGMESLVVRIHGDRAEKVDPRSQSLTLEQKTKVWIQSVEERAREYVRSKASGADLDANELAIAVLGEQRHIILLNIRHEMERLAATDEELAEGEDASSSEEDEIAKTSTLVDRRADIEEALNSLRSRLNSTEEELKRYGDFGSEVATSSEQESREWISVLSKSHVPQAATLKAHIELQLEWFNRLGASKKFHGAVLGDARIVAGTCVGLGNVQSLGDQTFDLCIVDEVSKASATETLIPMSRSKTWVLVGDSKQLPPFPDLDPNKPVDQYPAEEAHATLLGIFASQLPAECKFQLTEQRRMVGGIGRLVSQLFYDSSLVTVRTVADRGRAIAKVFPKEVEWHSTSKIARHDEEEMPGKTFRNRIEALLVQQLLVKLNQANKGKPPIHVAVIAGYSAQVNALDQQLKATAAVLDNLRVEINTVDAFQGRDADVCIYSVTRSNDKYRLGFQREARRLNVALSRGRDSLVIVGDDSFCRNIERDNPFRAVLSHIDQFPSECSLIRYDGL